MKKSLMLVLSFALAFWLSGTTQAAAQGKGQGGGKPASTGLEHAEATANPKGVEHGIENAESKQGKEDTDASKNKGKAKGKKHKHNKKNSNAASH